EDSSSSLTQEGSVMGTPDYIAPEQALDSHTADIRADIYSLGCSLYYLLTRLPPFPGGTLAEKLVKHQLQDPPAVDQLRPDVPPALAAVVRKMLAKRPEDRYQTPAEVAVALAPFAYPPGGPAFPGGEARGTAVDPHAPTATEAVTAAFPQAVPVETSPT